MSRDSQRTWRRRASLVLATLTLPLTAWLLALQARWLDELASAREEELRQALASGVERVASELQSTLGALERAFGRAPDAFAAERPELVAEVFELAPEEDVPVDAPAFGVALPDGTRWALVLDAARLEDELFPSLVRRALGPDALSTYHARVVPVDGVGPTLFLSDPEEGSAPEGRPDASVELTLVPNRWFDSLDGSWVDLPRPVFIEEGRGGRQAHPRGKRWRLELHHRDGSLELALARARTRNLLLGGGLLLGLVAGLALLWIAEQRARRLAEKELAFVAGVSHELRTPLTVVRTAASNLESGAVRDPGRVAEYGALIEGEVTRLGVLVDRVLRFSSARAAPLACEPVDVEALISDAVALCEPWRGRRHFDVAVEVAEDVETVPGDRGALTSALHNLIENAIKYGEDGQTIRVAACVREGVEIAVRNPGNGIAPHESSRIFEPFFRGENARVGGQPGSGLGLGVARDAVLAHGGRLDLETASGEVAFTLRLPVSGER